MIAYSLKRESINGFAWRFIQNVSTQLIGFIIQIILARILLPTDYGIIALTSTFVTILNVIITTGFSSSIVQKRDLTELDKSSMFYLSVFVGVLLYLFIFFLAPVLADFYDTKLLISILRVQGISLIVASIFSVHTAIIQRNLEFKKTFIASFIAVICQGIVGITLALKGFGVWALVFGTITQNVINCIALFIICRWRPKLSFSFSSTKKMVSFSSKVLAGNVLNAIFNSSKTLLMGHFYDKNIVGYYNKGNQFPSTAMTGFEGAMSTVLFSSLSKLQNDKKSLVNFLRKSLRLSLTICVPMMFGMAAISDPLIRLLLTNKWEGAIPFVMIECVLCLMWPLNARAQAINAIGKSGVNLSINICINTLTVCLLVASIPFGVYVMCLSSIIGSFLSFIVYSFVLKKYLNYRIKDQLFDILPIFAIGFLMFCFVYVISLFLEINLVLKIIVLCTAGAAFYLGISYIFKMEGLIFILDMIKTFAKNRRKRNYYD